jgi:hypothetical protein
MGAFADPVVLASFALICVILYTLIEGESSSEDTNNQIMIAELALAFVASGMTIYTFIFSIFFGIISGRWDNNLVPFLMIIVCPFTFTGIRSILRTYKPNKTYNKYLAILTIPSALFSIYVMLVIYRVIS